MPQYVMCKNCNNYRNDWCERVIDSPDPDMQRDCQHFWEKTNADRIRAMSDEELAERLIFWNDDWGRWETDAGNFAGDPNDTKETAIKAELEWLKQPAEVDNG